MEPIKPEPKNPTPLEDETKPEAGTTPEVEDIPVALEPTDGSDEDSGAGKVDDKTDKAVDDIMKKEGDEVLHAQDESAEKAIVMKQSRRERLKDFMAEWWANPKKKWGTIAGAIVLVALLLAVPFTGANILGLFLKSNATVQVVDSKTGAPVSGATVELAGVKGQTEANGKVTLHVHAGSKRLTVTKKYYAGYAHRQLVGLSGKHNNFKAPVVATGRQVSIKVVNKLTGKPLPGVTLSASGANVKTGKDGTATLVLPSGADTATANVSLSSYNSTKVDINTAGDVTKNTFSLTPAGKLYFLSNLSGKIDVVKTNLDGTDRQTVLAGTGSEDRYSTSLLASRDWKYLALLSKRSGTNASIYLIDTTNGDKLTTIDQGDASFSLVGWSGSHFVYQVTRNTVADWQPNKHALKSLDASTKQVLLLDQTGGQGTDAHNYAQENYGSVYLSGNAVVYDKTWFNYYAFLNGDPVTGKLQSGIYSINTDGSNHQTLKTFGNTLGWQTSVSSYLDGTASIYYQVTDPYAQSLGKASTSYFEYEDAKLASKDDLSQNFTSYYNGGPITYLYSPSGNQTFWGEQRDGKNTLFVGDQNAKNQKQIASLSEYNTYGWFTDDYLLVSKGSSELYIMPSSGGTPFKITDYYKPAINYNGYGGGYGGL